MDVAGDLARQPGHRLELLAARLQEALRRAEVLEDAPLSRRAHAGELVEDRAGHRPVTASTVELDREPVRLVADALEQLQLGRIVRQTERSAAAGREDLLDPLRQADHGDAEIAERSQLAQARRQLALAAVDHDQRRNRREALVELPVVRAPLALLDVLGHSS